MICVESGEYTLNVLTYPKMELVYSVKYTFEDQFTKVLHPNGNLIIENGDEFLVYDRTGALVMRELLSEDDPEYDHCIHAIAFTIDGESVVLATSSDLRPLRILTYSIRSQEVTSTIELGPCRPFANGAFSGNLQRLVLETDTGVRVYDVETGAVVHEFEYVEQVTVAPSIHGLLISNDGNRVLAQIVGMALMSSSVITGETVSIANAMCLLSLSYDDSFVYTSERVVGHTNYFERLRDVNTLELVCEFDNKDDSVLSPYDEIVSYAGGNGVTVQKLGSTASYVLESPVSIRDITFSPPEFVVLM
jgi:WD40 repeat protein